MVIGERLLATRSAETTAEIPTIQDLALIARESGFMGPMQVACDARAILGSPGASRAQLMRQAAMSRDRYTNAQLLLAIRAERVGQPDHLAADIVDEPEVQIVDTTIEAIVVDHEPETPALDTFVETVESGAVVSGESGPVEGSFGFSDVATARILGLIAKSYRQQGHADEVDLSPGSVDEDFLVALIATYGEQPPLRRTTEELLARDTGIVMKYLGGTSIAALSTEYSLTTVSIQLRLERVASIAARALSLAERPAVEQKQTQDTPSPRPRVVVRPPQPGVPRVATPISLPVIRRMPIDTLPLLPSDQNPLNDGRALCAQTDPEIFFPEKGGSTREAKKICAGCEVRAECLAYALNNDERFGIWGGLSERERRRLKRAAG